MLGKKEMIGVTGLMLGLSACEQGDKTIAEKYQGMFKKTYVTMPADIVKHGSDITLRDGMRIVSNTLNKTVVTTTKDKNGHVVTHEDTDYK